MKVSAGKSILSANDQQAARNLDRLTRDRLLAINILASPGAGKTSVIKRLLAALSPAHAVGVIEGDVASSIDTDAIVALGYPATQINTDGGCHLDAAMIDRALEALRLRGPGFLFIENIGNLICPTGFRLGESLRLLIASVPEGDDKPLKYPGAFATADAIVLNKMDLMPLVDFKMDSFLAAVRTVNRSVPVCNISCRNGMGFDALVGWLLEQGSRRPWMRR